jgi:DNA-binding transcriptional LysR family regulator
MDLLGSQKMMDLELLRTFVAVVDSGGFARAGARRHLTQSTVSQQMKRLAEQAGQPLFSARGRRRVPTAAAEVLLGYAKRLVALHDDAARALGEGGGSDSLRIGVTQDFAEARLPAALRAFALAHPRSRVEVRVAASPELSRQVEAGTLDLAVVFEAAEKGAFAPLAREKGCWLGGRGFVPPAPGEPWPLALFDAPCVFRDAALAALDAARLPFRVVYSTPSLSGLLAAVRAGLAVTLRLSRHTQKGVFALGAKHGLPSVGTFRVALVTAETPSAVSRAMAAILRSEMRRR